MKNKKRNFDPLVLSAKIFGRFITVIQEFMMNAYDGIIPPLLGYRKMYELIDSDYSDVGLYETEKHNKSGFYLWELEAIGKYFTPGAHFMVLAAGGGREVLALLAKGVHVDAWECNERLRDFGNRLLRDINTSCRIQPIQPSKFPQIPDGKRYDFCIVGWSAYCHILKKEDRITLLAEARKVVKGPILISFVLKKRAPRLKRILRRVFSLLPRATDSISYDLVAKPGTIAVGFDENKIVDEAEAAGLVLMKYKNHYPSYPYALLVPDPKDTL